MKILLLSMGTVLSIVCHTLNASEDYQSVSVLQLVAVPEKYLGKKIETVGYSASKSSLDIYPSSESAKMGDVASIIFVIDETESGAVSLGCSHLDYLKLRGVFSKNRESFEINTLASVSNALTHEKCWEK